MRCRDRVQVVVPVITAAVVLAACGGSDGGGGLPKTDSDALANVVKAVDKAHPGTAWWKHVRREIKSGFIADAKIYTDYAAEDLADMVEISRLCNAFVTAMHGDRLVVVYGSVTTRTEQIDGSVKKRVDDDYKLAEGNEDGCDAHPYYVSIEKQLTAKGIPVEPFGTKADAPDEIG